MLFIGTWVLRIETMADVDDKKYASTPLKGDSKEKDQSDNEGIRLQPKMSLVNNYSIVVVGVLLYLKP